MVNKMTFLKYVSMITESVDTWRQKLSKNDILTDKEKDEIIKGNVMINDTITMLETEMGDRFRVIRDYVFEREANGEFFFAVVTASRMEAVLIDSPQALYEYLQDEGKNCSA